MHGKTALVTGGSSGIGKGIATVLAEKGYDVAITYAGNRDGARDTVESIQSLGRRGFAIEAHLEEPSAAPRAVRSAIEALGHLDLLVNNAGKTINHSILSLTNEDIDYIFNLNCKAYLLGTGAAARHMVRQGIKGSIIFITSTHGSRAYAEDVLYGGFKAAIDRACQSMALDLAPHGIRVNCIAPGMTKVRGDLNELDNTPFAKAIPLGRFGTPRETGELAAFLADDKCAYITGQCIRIDGGLILPGMMEYSRISPELVHSQTKPDWWEYQKKSLEEFKEDE